MTDMTEPRHDNDGTVRRQIWRRHVGDDWAAFDSLPPDVRQRLCKHAYEPWSVNAALLWRHFRRQHAKPERAERAILRQLDFCERLEREAFEERYRAAYGDVLPHTAARATILR